MRNKPSFRHHFDTLSDNDLDDLADVHEGYPITTSDHDNMINEVTNEKHALTQELGHEPYLDIVKKPSENSNES